MENQNTFPYHFNNNSCKTCGGKCCRGRSGYVWASMEELQKMAVAREMDFSSFFEHYVRQVEERLALQERFVNNEYLCCFFDPYDTRCTIYENRPEQCRTFPFWERYKDNPQQILIECPGISVSEADTELNQSGNHQSEKDRL